MTACLAACVLLTILTGLVLGWFAVWFQLLGDRPDADDYASAAGAYGAAALVLVVGTGALTGRAAPRWVLVAAVAAAGLFTVLLLSSISDMTAAEPSTAGAGWQEGAFGVLGCPWVWPLVVLGLLRSWRRPETGPPEPRGPADRSRRRKSTIPEAQVNGSAGEDDLAEQVTGGHRGEAVPGLLHRQHAVDHRT